MKLHLFEATRWMMVAALALAGTMAAGQQLEERTADTQAVEAGAGQQAPAESAGLDLSKVARQIIEGTNRFRAGHERKPVAPQSALSAAAQYFADYMARTNRYGHGADGNRPSERAAQHGYDYCIVSENIAYQYNSAGYEASELAKAFTQGWIDSPPHRKNMLDRDVVDVGVAVARSDSGVYYAVQMFGRPKSMQIEFAIANRSTDMAKYTVDGREFALPPRVTRTHTRCRPPKLTFAFEDRSEPLRPQDGARYTITGEAGDLAVLRESEKGG